MRKSPGLTKRMNSGDSWFSSVYDRDRVGRRRPELRVAAAATWALSLSVRVGVAAVAVGAAEAERVLEVRVVGVLVAGDAAGALGGGLLGRLAEQVDADQFRRHRERVDTGRC